MERSKVLDAQTKGKFESTLRNVMDFRPMSRGENMFSDLGVGETIKTTVHADTAVQTVKHKDAPTITRMPNDASNTSLIANDAFQPRELNRDPQRIYDTEGSIVDENSEIKRFNVDKHQR